MSLRFLLRRSTSCPPRMAGGVNSRGLSVGYARHRFDFCAAIGLWDFEFGKDIASLDQDTTDTLKQA